MKAKEEAIAAIRRLLDGFIAGMLISVGGAVYLACYTEMPPIGKFVGGLFFCTALFCICTKGFALYTGKIGYVLEKHSKEDISVMLLGLLGNFLGTVACGYLIAAAIPSIGANASALCGDKLETQALWQTLIRAFFCGILVYLAVDLYRNHKTPLGIFLCIPTFIFSGYEHSIADMFYFAAANAPSWDAFFFIWVVIAGNSIGGLFIPLLKSLGSTKKPNPAPPDPNNPPAENCIIRKARKPTRSQKLFATSFFVLLYIKRLHFGWKKDIIFLAT